MEVVSNDERTLTELDHARLTRLIRDLRPADGRASVASLLDDADRVPSRAIRPDVVTMYSQVRLVDVATRRSRTLTLCYPSDAEPDAGFVSVLSPVGASLLGRRVGSVATWSSPSGETSASQVAAICFQPEESGDYST